MGDTVKGVWRGVCFTPGCDAKARFISLVDAWTAPGFEFLSRHRCEDCCDGIANRVANGCALVEVAGMSKVELGNVSS